MKRIPISEIGLILLLATSGFPGQKMESDASPLAAPGAAADCPTTVEGDQAVR